MAIWHTPNPFWWDKVDGASIVFNQVAVAVEYPEVECEGFAGSHDGRPEQARVLHDGMVNDVERVWVAECANGKLLVGLGNS